MAIMLVFGGMEFCALAVDWEPVLVGRYDTIGNAYDVVVSSNYAYVADGSAGLQIIEVSNPANPQRVGGNSAKIPFYGVTIRGDKLFMADGTNGLVILNLFTPGPR